MSNGWVAQPEIFLFDRKSGLFRRSPADHPRTDRTFGRPRPARARPLVAIGCSLCLSRTGRLFAPDRPGRNAGIN